MNKCLTLLSAALVTSAVAVVGGCHTDGQSDGQRSSMSDGSRPLEGNPGATTGPAAGYDRSDPTHYHPQTDDTHQYHPANPAAVQPNH